jgi:glucose-6-phosphate 1-dehydrogenase
MSDSHSDALVFFGATGDLAYKKIFPALQAMIKRGHLNVPVIGVAKAGWNLEQLRARAHDSLEKHGGIDTAALNKLTGLLRYVDGDYADPTTFQAIRKELSGAQRPAHYLAIPPLLFGTVVEQLAKSDSAEGARVVVEKPFGNDLASAQELNRILHAAFPEFGIFRIDHSYCTLIKPTTSVQMTSDAGSTPAAGNSSEITSIHFSLPSPCIQLHFHVIQYFRFLILALHRLGCPLRNLRLNSVA